MESCEGGEPYCNDVLDDAQENVGKRLRAGVCGQTNAGFRPMRAESEGATSEQGGDTDCRIEVRNCRSCEHRPGGNANERLDNTTPTPSPPPGLSRRSGDSLAGQSSSRRDEPGGDDG